MTHQIQSLKNMYLKRVSFFCFILIGISFIVGCKQDADTLEIETIAFNKLSYPLKVGNWWRYRVLDFNSNFIDTLQLKIVRQTVNNAEVTYTFYLHEFGAIVDSAQMVLSATELTYKGMDPHYSYFGDFKLKLPFYQGDTWKGFSEADSTKVISYSKDYEVMGKNYDIYYLKRLVYGNVYSVVQNLQLSKGVGIVSQNINVFSGGFVQRQNFQLIDYELK